VTDRGRQERAVLTAEQILVAAEDVLRRYGPAKATVVDVARALGVSHGSVYRHFASKAALREAVAERFLAGMSAPLADIVDADLPAPERLRRWLDALIASKRAKALEDPELFATYVTLAAESGDVIRDHVDHLVGQLETIIADGADRGELTAPDSRQAARAVFDATARWHDPTHAASWAEPGVDEAFEGVYELLAAGLGAAQTSTRPASSAHSSAAR
jgi:AcrR family transcriptional regulator